MSVPPGTIPLNHTRPTLTRAKDSNTRLQEGQYETSVPVIMDRCHQGRVRNALEPEWEARFEPKSYGFRPGRSCQDAIETLFNTMSGKNAKRLWVLDADLAAAFDRIDHDHLLFMLGSFPDRDLIRAWLKAAYSRRARDSPRPRRELHRAG